MFHALFSLAPALWSIRNDFGNYYVPARLVREGVALDRAYERDFLQVHAGRLGIGRAVSFVPHPPLNALWLVPLAGLDPLSAKRLSVAALSAALILAGLVLRRVVDLPAPLLALVFLLPSAATANALDYVQPYPVLLLCLAGFAVCLAGGRPLWAGALLAPVVLAKLYGLPLLAWLLWERRWRPLLGFAVGAALLAGFELLVLGSPVHRAYLDEILPRSLRGEIQDPYSPVWGSATSLAFRLFQAEPFLNPRPLLDAPRLASASAAFLQALPLFWSLAARVPPPHEPLRFKVALMSLAGLLASPLTASYHFVLLILPAALLLPGLRGGARIALLGLVTFAASPLPHYFFPLAHGLGNLLAHARWLSMWAILLLALRGSWVPRRASSAALAALAVGGFAGATRQPAVAPPSLVSASGYLAAEPIECGDAIGWLAIEGESYVARSADRVRSEAPLGRLLRPVCERGAVSGVLLDDAGSAAGRDADHDEDGRGRVAVDRPGRLLRDEPHDGPPRTLYEGIARWPRLSPDGARVVFSAWSDGSWDLWVADRSGGGAYPLTLTRANEIEPSWRLSGSAVLFASDERRGLGSTTLRELPLPARRVVR